MSNPQQETKIELVTEAVEALVLAQAVMLQNPGIKFHKQFVDAREGLKTAMRDLLTPTLRVMTNPTPPKPEHVPYDGMGIDGMNLA